MPASPDPPPISGLSDAEAAERLQRDGYNELNSPPPRELGDTAAAPRGAHIAVGSAITGLFAVNSVTGVWNMWESRSDPTHRKSQFLHGFLMLGADAGFVATFATGLAVPPPRLRASATDKPVSNAATLAPVRNIACLTDREERRWAVRWDKTAFLLAARLRPGG